MIIYVESNFVVELALEQKQSTAAEAILSLAENGEIKLMFSAFALSEPFSTVTRRWKKRDRLLEATGLEVQQIARAEKYRQLAFDLQGLFKNVRQIRNVNFDLLDSTVARMLKVGKSIGTEGAGFGQLLLDCKRRYDLALPDAIIYSTIIFDLKQQSTGEAKCFISRDESAFGYKSLYAAEIEAELNSHNCIFKSSFWGGLRLIKEELARNNQIIVVQEPLEGEQE